MNTPERGEQATTPPPAGASSVFLNRKLEDADITDGVPVGSYRDAVQAAEKSLRRAQDAALFQVLAEQEFAGRSYRRFEDELARYGLSVMKGWLFTGHIFQVTSSRHIMVMKNDALLHEVSASADARDELANATVAVALTKFRKMAAAGTGWKPDGGASLTTYFMGACVLAFPNEWRRLVVANEKWRRQTSASVESEMPNVVAEERGFDTGQTIGRNPATIAVSRAHSEQLINTLKPREQKIVLATDAGYSQEEIAEMFGEKSKRAVEGVLYRLHQTRKAEDPR